MGWVGRRVLRAAAALLAAAAAPGCGSDGTDEPVVDEEGFETLAEFDWEIAPGEVYYCLRKTFDEEILIDGFEAIAPPGTHHTVVTIGWPDGPAGGEDGLAECHSFEHHFDAFVFQSATAKKDRWELPEGVAARILPGQQVIINAHVLNATDDRMSGTTGTRIRRADPATDPKIAAATFMGPTLLEIPPGGETTQTGGCELSADVNFVAISPHAHQAARHMKVTAHSSEVGETVVLDQAFDFTEDHNYRLIDPEIPMKQGDFLEVSCTYENDTGEPIYWGLDYWTAEMCWAAMYLYPAETQTSACSAN